MNSNYPRLQFVGPVVQAWIFVILWWPVGDILRKWGGLNQPIYVLQLFTPVLLLCYLIKKRAWILRRLVTVPALALSLTTGVTALYYSMTEYSVQYLGVWLFSLSALLGPPLLFCSSPRGFVNACYSYPKLARNSIVIVSSLSLLNNLLSVIQSVVGRSHFLSVGAGGSFDAQIGTNTSIELRAPGFFTFATGNASFTIICVVFILASLGHRIESRVNLLRFLALLSVPFALVRSISRGFLFSLLVVTLPFSALLQKRRILASILVTLTLFFLFLIFFPGALDLFRDGLHNFDKRLLDAGGIREGILARFFNTLIFDAAGSSESLFTNLVPWFRSDPLAMLFGYGLGFSGPLFRFVQGAQDTAYGFVQFEGRQFLVGETFYSSLLAELGIINLFFYFWLAINTLRLFVKNFPLLPFSSSRSYVYAALLAFLLQYVTPYFRPAAVLSFSLWALTPHVCRLLFSTTKSIRFSQDYPPGHPPLSSRTIT